MEDILGRVLNIETEAKAIVSEAQGLVLLLKEQAKFEAEQMRIQARHNAEKEAVALREQVEQEVQEARAHILAQADQQSEHVQKMDHFAEAAAYVVAAILGQEEGQG